MLGENGQITGAGILSSKTIVEIDPSDGSLLRRVSMGSAPVRRVCVLGGEYLFLSAHRQEGTLEPVKAASK